MDRGSELIPECCKYAGKNHNEDGNFESQPVFRWHAGSHHLVFESEHDGEEDQGAHDGKPYLKFIHCISFHSAGYGGESYAAPWEARVDRKSTRLNSSHLVISYAVFCLKKKT